jgi:hypothetical protein
MVGENARGAADMGSNLVASLAARAAPEWDDLCTPRLRGRKEFPRPRTRRLLKDFRIRPALLGQAQKLRCAVGHYRSGAARTHCAGLPLRLGSIAMTALAITVSDLGTSRASWRLRSGPPRTRRSNVLR